MKEGRGRNWLTGHEDKEDPTWQRPWVLPASLERHERTRWNQVADYLKYQPET